MRELSLRKVDKESRALKEERVQGPQGGTGPGPLRRRKGTNVFFLYCFVLVT